MNRKQKIHSLTCGALIAALYVAFTYVSALFGLSGGVIQLRLSEMLSVLPAILPAVYAPGSVLGLFTGCILANALTGALVWDIVFGSLATLIGALGTYALRRAARIGITLAPVPPILANTLIVPFVLQQAYGAGDALWFLMLTVGIGEVLSCGVLGTLLTKFLTSRFQSMQSMK